MFEIKATILGSCGKEHASFEEWQDCKACESIIASHNKAGKTKSAFEIGWNAAIEAAALKIPKYEDDNMNDIREEIRKLRK